jgi:hypothetical protein
MLKTDLLDQSARALGLPLKGCLKLEVALWNIMLWESIGTLLAPERTLEELAVVDSTYCFCFDFLLMTGPFLFLLNDKFLIFINSAGTSINLEMKEDLVIIARVGFEFEDMEANITRSHRKFEYSSRNLLRTKISHKATRVACNKKPTFFSDSSYLHLPNEATK